MTIDPAAATTEQLSFAVFPATSFRNNLIELRGGTAAPPTVSPVASQAYPVLEQSPAGKYSEICRMKEDLSAFIARY